MEMTRAVGVAECTPQELAEALAAGGVAVDVREPGEIAAERVPGVRAMPLSRFDEHGSGLDRARPVYVVCRSGTRARQAALRLAAAGHEDVRVVAGGILAWSAAGLPVERGASAVWAMERQVRLAAGALVLLGVAMGVFVHPALLALAGFVGAGLAFSAVTDSCGMAMVLARMPWNRRGAAACGPAERR